MTIMTRFLRLMKADVHGVMDQLEDKGLLLRQYLREMETSLGHKEAQLNALSDRMERLSVHVQRQEAEMKKVDQDVDLALSKEKDDIARTLIRRHRDLEIATGHLEEQIGALAQEKTRLVETINDQKLQYDTLQARAEVWHRRAADEPFVSATRSFPNAGPPSHSCDEEIELALIRRKAALDRQGGAA
jgi:phage shock protein A